MRLYVGNLPYSTTEKDLAKIFRPFGMVLLPMIPRTDKGEARGIGFIEMLADTDAQQAIRELNGSEYKGRKLRVAPARENFR